MGGPPIYNLSSTTRYVHSKISSESLISYEEEIVLPEHFHVKFLLSGRRNMKISNLKMPSVFCSNQAQNKMFRILLLPLKPLQINLNTNGSFWGYANKKAQEAALEQTASRSPKEQH